MIQPIKSINIFVASIAILIDSPGSKAFIRNFLASTSPFLFWQNGQIVCESSPVFLRNKIPISGEVPSSFRKLHRLADQSPHC